MVDISFYSVMGSMKRVSSAGLHFVVRGSSHMVMLYGSYQSAVCLTQQGDVSNNVKRF